MARANNWSESDEKTRTATSVEMKEMFNDWCADVESWMKPETLEQYWRMKRQKQHQLRKSRFSTFLFHIAGCKFLLTKLIEIPIIAQLSETVGQPAAEHVESMLQFFYSYEEHKQTEEYKDAVRQSQKR